MPIDKRKEHKKGLRALLSQATRAQKISVKDIKRWGLRGITDSHGDYSKPPKGVQLVKLPEGAVIVDEKGIIARTTKQKTMAFYEWETGKIGVGKENDFFTSIPELIPTLSQINTWKKREENLLDEEKRLLNNYIERDVSLDDGSPKLQKERKENLRNGLIKDQEWFKRMIKAQKEYEAMSPEEQALRDSSDRLRNHMRDYHLKECMKRKHW